MRFTSRRDVTCVCRSVTLQESDERAGLQSVPRNRMSGRERLPSYFSSGKVDGRFVRPSSRRICTCQATAPGSLMVLRYFSSATFSKCLVLALLFFLDTVGCTLFRVKRRGFCFLLKEIKSPPFNTFTLLLCCIIYM